jgi:cytochrome b pre-mRNA-processing protein 3
MDALRRSLDDPPRRRRAGAVPLRVWFLGSVVVLLGACLLFIWIWSQRAEERAIRSLPEAKRRALYQRTLDDVSAVCTAGHAADLTAHCTRQARFIVQFPECDATCRRLASAHLGTPTR